MLKKILVLSSCLVFCSTLSAKDPKCKPSQEPINKGGVQGTLITISSCEKIFKPNKGLPYCVEGCFEPLDCRGNKHAIKLEKGKRWGCDRTNATTPCGGKCIVVDKGEKAKQ